jgi:hypothetical protein
VAKDLLRAPDVTPLNLYAYDNISPEGLVLEWNNIGDIAVYADYTYRVMRSISIIRYYWRLSAVLVSVFFFFFS